MRSSPDCLVCALRQCREMARLLGRDGQVENRVEEHARQVAAGLSFDEPPSTYTSRVLVSATEFLGSKDPYARLKQEQNQQAARAARAADQKLGTGPDSLRTALMLAAAGNVIDSGPRHSFSLDQALAELRFGHDDSGLLLERLAGARRVMYILDNAGEVMFDVLVLKRLPKADVTIVARSSPILNDVTVDEAQDLGLGEYGRILGTGSRFLGIDFGSVSDEFRTAYEQADVVIAKGHANFESLLGRGRDGFYVLKAKCEMVAEPLGVELGESACCYSAGEAG